MMIRKCLLLSLAFYTAKAQRVIRLNFHFGFFDVGYTPSLADIQKNDVEALICQTQTTLSNMAREQSVSDNNINVNARDIDWSYDGEKERPATISFALEVLTGADNQEVEGAYDIMMNTMDDMNIVDFMENLTGFFQHTNNFGWDIAQGPSMEGQLEVAECGPVTTNSPTVSPTLRFTVSPTDIAVLPAPQALGENENELDAFGAEDAAPTKDTLDASVSETGGSTARSAAISALFESASAIVACAMMAFLLS